MLPRWVWLSTGGCLLSLALGACTRPEGTAAQSSPGDRQKSAREQKQPVEVTQIVRRDLAETLNVVGSVAANESAEVRAEVAGLVRAIHFDEGQTVKKGDVLLKIDDSELVAQLAQAESRFQLAELNLQRAEALRQSQSNTQADFDRARTEFASSRADLSILKLRLEKTEVKAPFDGVVGARELSPGDYVSIQTPITRIEDTSRLKMEFQVPERFLAKVEAGTRFTVLSRSFNSDRPLQGEVYFVAPAIDRATRSSIVKGMLMDPPPSVRPGMFANIEVVLDVRPQVLAVPEGAVLTTSSGTSIIVVKDAGSDKVAEFVPVSLGLRARGLVEIAPSQGTLAEGASIVASGVGGLVLFPGAKLDPRPLKDVFRVGG